MPWAAIATAAGQLAGAQIEKNSQNSAIKAANKRSFLQSLYLMEQQKAWEKEKATHAHQWEMEDLKNANLNPALTATGGSGASTGSLSAPTTAMGEPKGLQLGSMATLLEQVSNIKNNTKATNANANLADAQAMQAVAQTKNIPFKNKIDLMNAISGEIHARASATSAAAAMKNALTTEESANKGIGGKIFGNKNTNTAGSIAAGAATLIPGFGLVKGIKAAHGAYKAYKQGKNFGKFLKAIGG